MIANLVLFFALASNFLFAAPYQQTHSSPELELQIQYQLQKEPLVIEKVWEIDPSLWDAHVKRWIISREIIPYGVEAVEEKNKSNKTFFIQAKGLVVKSEGHVRALGPWFQSYDLFSCSQNPDQWFQTFDGAQIAASVAAENWFNLVRKEKIKLSILWKRIQALSKKEALESGEIVFQTWMSNLSTRWKSEFKKETRKKEWEFYLKQASESKICKGKQIRKVQVPSLRELMEPTDSNYPQYKQLLIHAPARLWNGSLTVRANLKVGDKKINGKFIIDSSANRSVIDPSWLKSQGVLLPWIKYPKNLLSFPFEKILFSGLWDSQGGLAELAFIDEIEISGMKLPFREFLIWETDLKEEQRNTNSCCDGILGLDFLRYYPVEFQAERPTELKVWAREKYRAPEDYSWIEISRNENGTLMSSCEVFAKGNKKILSGVQLDTGNEHSLQIHTPHQHFFKSESAQWNLRCGKEVLAQNLTPHFPIAPHGAKKEGLLSANSPAATLGMAFLLRGHFIFDLPHGRIWFKKKDWLEHSDVKNTSGLGLAFVHEKNQRVLKVISIDPKSPAMELKKHGLKVGTILTQVNEQRVEDMEVWDIEQLLSNKTLPRPVTLQWKTLDGLKSVPF